MSNWNVLLKPRENRQTTATILELPTFCVTAETRQLAVEKIQHLLAQRLANAEVAPLA